MRKISETTVVWLSFCALILLAVIFAVLWDERELIAKGLLGAGGLVLLVFIAHCFNEMALRRERFYHGSETPLAQPAPQPRYNFQAEEANHG